MLAAVVKGPFIRAFFQQFCCFFNTDACVLAESKWGPWGLAQPWPHTRHPHHYLSLSPYRPLFSYRYCLCPRGQRVELKQELVCATSGQWTPTDKSSDW